MSKKKNVEKTKFIVVDIDSILDTETTLDKAIAWVNDNYDAPESEDFQILEVVGCYNLVASKVGAEQVDLSAENW